MTPAEEATFIALWTEGLEIAVISQRLGKARHDILYTGGERSRPYHDFHWGRAGW